MEDLLKSLEVYTKGTAAWFPDEKEGWLPGILTSKTLDDGVVRMAFKIEGRDKEYVLEKSLEKLVKAGPNLPPLKNPPILEGVDDLAELSYLHEPAVLHNVRLRYSQELIYTYSGIVLIAVNPFQYIPMYSPDIMRTYSGKKRGELEPHLFAVADEAYKSMIMNRKNQSIIVSGESGAGKTQSAKYIMRYFAMVDDLEAKTKRKTVINLVPGDESEKKQVGIEDAVLSTNPIMESFGNAKTIRNDNSSRFGKYIEILFSDPDRNGRVVITGARICTYLLERSRLIFQPSKERNYHIFYQMCAGAPAAERKALGLESWEQYFYLNQGQAGVVNGMNDAEEFSNTQKALSMIGISVTTQWDIFKICAALLHMGNIQITEVRDEATISNTDTALVQAAKLLGVDPEMLIKWITKKQIVTRSEKIVSNLNAQQANVGRDAISKFVYSMIFDWMVKTVNMNLARDATDGQRFIGVLDIYGFEHFAKNSFEQFCINYANEKLQQEFNRHVFKLEQEEYIAEQINWSFITFNDNQSCISLIENKLGILDLLDEESFLPSGTDDSLVTKLCQKYPPKSCPEADHFEKPRFGTNSFIVKHYAQDVEYTSDGFIAKNKDSVTDEQLSVLHSSSSTFLLEVVKIPEIASKPVEPARPGGKVARKPTLGSVFKQSLVSLTETIRSTQVHYIRCIKPNQEKVAFAFEAPQVLGQLRACGVLETIRISCMGYPSRWTYAEFADRYYLLVRSNNWKKLPRVLTQTIVDHHIKDADKFQMGLSKVFFRAGQLAFLEKLRSEKLNACITLIQSQMLRHLYQTRYRVMKKAAILIQGQYRGYRARKLVDDMRRTRAAIRIQTAVRGFLCHMQYYRLKSAVVRIQAAYRKRVASRANSEKLRGHAALTIQRVYRGYLARKEVRRMLKLIVFIQSCIRRKLAVRVRRALKLEAGNATKLKEVNYKLEMKLMEVSQGLTAKTKENNQLNEVIATLENQNAHLKERLEKIVFALKNKEEESLEQIISLKKEIMALVAERDMMARENEKSVHVAQKKEMDLITMETDLADSRETIRKLHLEIKELKNAPKSTDPSIIEALKKEIIVLKDQNAKLLSGKYRGDRIVSVDADMASPSRSGSATDLSITPAPAISASPKSLPPKAVVVVTQRHEKVGGSRGTLADSSDFSSRPISTTAPVAMPIQIDRSKGRSKKIQSNMLVNSVSESSTGSLAQSDATASSSPINGGELRQTESPANTQQFMQILDDKALEDEIVEAMIINLRIPLPSTQTVATKIEIFFPAHLIGRVFLQLVEVKMAIRLQGLAENVLKSLQNLVMKFEDDYVSAFWLSNTFVLSNVVKSIQDAQARARSRRKIPVASDTEKALEKINADVEDISRAIYYGWTRELSKRLENMVVPAVIENQSLPGYICKQSGSLWGLKWSQRASVTGTFTIEQLLNFLSKLSKTLRCYYMEESVIRQILTELLRVIGTESFNHLVMRRNFCTWKRGVQIQYNVSRIEEWCTSHGIAEATLHLQRLLQAAKLLTLNKTSPQDIETIFDVCFLLNASQIKKILSIYYAADFDSPLSPELLKLVTARAVVNEKTDIILLSSDAGDEYRKPSTRGITEISGFIPNWMSLPLIEAITKRSKQAAIVSPNSPEGRIGSSPNSQANTPKASSNALNK